MSKSEMFITDIQTMKGAVHEAAHGKPVYYTGCEPVIIDWTKSPSKEQIGKDIANIFAQLGTPLKDKNNE